MMSLSRDAARPAGSCPGSGGVALWLELRYDIKAKQKPRVSPGKLRTCHSRISGTLLPFFFLRLDYGCFPRFKSSVEVGGGESSKRAEKRSKRSNPFLFFWSWPTQIPYRISDII